MKKIISLVLAAVLVLGLATVAIAATPAGGEISAVADIPTTVTLDAGEKVEYILTGDAAQSVIDKEIILSSEGKEGALWTNPYFGAYLDEWGNWTTQGTPAGNAMSGFTFGVENTTEETVTYTISWAAAWGSMGNPDTSLDLEWSNYCYPPASGDYYYQYTAGAEGPELLTISDIILNYNALNMSNLTFNIMLTREDGKVVELYNADGSYKSSISIALAAEESVLVLVRAQENEDTSVDPGVEFKAAVVEAPEGTDRTQIEISAMGDYEGTAPANFEVNYLVNSMLAGKEITVTGASYIIVGDTKIDAVEGVAAAILDGEGATIPVIVGNTGAEEAEYAINIDYAPEAITATGDFTANVPAKGENEYEVNSKLAGAILTVKGENAYILMGETKVVAVEGVATVVLDGEGATIPVVIGNSGDEAAAFAASIAYGPTEINAVGDYDVTVAPKGEAAFVVNSKLHGAVITVKGEGAYLIIDGGEKIVAKDGVVSAKLEAKAATISVIVGNDGTEAGVWVLNVATAGTPETGDFAIVAAGIAIALSAIGGTAVIAKKKEN